MRLMWAVVGVGTSQRGSARAAEDIEIAPDAAFAHHPTGIILPAKIGELPRDRLTILQKACATILARHILDRNATPLFPVYIYRPVITDISLTTDVVMDLISTQHTPEKAAKLAPVAFTPAGRDIADLLMIHSMWRRRGNILSAAWR